MSTQYRLFKMGNNITLSILTAVLYIGIRESAAKSIPANVAALRASITAGACARPLKTGFYSTEDGPDSISSNNLPQEQLLTEYSLVILR